MGITVYDIDAVDGVSFVKDGVDMTLSFGELNFLKRYKAEADQEFVSSGRHAQTIAEGYDEAARQADARGDGDKAEEYRGKAAEVRGGLDEHGRPHKKGHHKHKG